MWFALSLLSAFGQALGWALKKKTLENKGINNSIGVGAYLVAGLLLSLMYGFANDWMLPELSQRFWTSCGVIIVLNILAAWMAYRALDIAPLSFLMPFVALSALGLVPVEYFLRDVVPNMAQIAGIAVLVLGAIVFSARQVTKVPVRAVLYFVVTIMCYAITPAFAAVAIRDAGTSLLPAAIYHLGMSAGFLLLLFHAKEQCILRQMHEAGSLKKIAALVALTGVVIALLENGPNMIALASANASEVMAVKRTMPFFALVLGIFMFNEKVTRRHVVGTTLLVAGAVLVVWFKG